jgi:hypothetical protein
MKKFCFNIFLFFTLVAISNAIIFIFSQKKYYGEYEKHPNKKYTAFIFSDSHGLPLANYSEEFNVFNFSSESESYFDIKRKLVYLFENGYKVDKIYITVDDHTLSPYREKSNNLDRGTIYSSADEYDFRLEYIKIKYINYYLPIINPKVSRIFKSYLISGLKKMILPNEKNPIKKSWINLSHQERINFSKERLKYQFPSNNKSDLLEKALIEIIDLCRTHKVEIVGIKFPLARPYIDMINNKNYGADKVFASKGMNVYNFQSLYINNPEYFFDQDHLNDYGAKIFVKYLLNEKTNIKAF